MPMKKLKKVATVLAALLVMGPLFYPLPLNAQQDIEFDLSELVIETADGSILKFNVELAESSAQKSRGLMFRREMAPDAGMLFLHSKDRVLTMWIANTILPLDMLFIAADGKIARIQEQTIPQSREVISSRKRVRAVLELNAGTVRKHAISVGDRVIHNHFN